MIYILKKQKKKLETMHKLNTNHFASMHIHTIQGKLKAYLKLTLIKYTNQEKRYKKAPKKGITLACNYKPAVSIGETYTTAFGYPSITQGFTASVTVACVRTLVVIMGE